MTLGIGVITYERQMMLRICLNKILEFTHVPYFLIVAEDGGKDGTADFCRHLDFTTVTGKNRGVSWNKNRALHLLSRIGADPIILLEDNCWPVTYGWEDELINAVEEQSHINRDSISITKLTALGKVGYLDNKFMTGSFADVEWANRFYRQLRSLPFSYCHPWKDNEERNIIYRETYEALQNNPTRHRGR